MISLTWISMQHDELTRLAGPRPNGRGGSVLSRDLSLVAAALAFLAALGIALSGA